MLGARFISLSELLNETFNFMSNSANSGAGKKRKKVEMNRRGCKYLEQPQLL